MNEILAKRMMTPPIQLKPKHKQLALIREHRMFGSSLSMSTKTSA